MPTKNETAGLLNSEIKLLVMNLYSCLHPKQLSLNSTTLSASTSFTQDAQASSTNTSAQNNQQGRSPLDTKQQDMKENLTVLRVQGATAKEELGKLNQQEKEYVTLASL